MCVGERFKTIKRIVIVKRCCLQILTERASLHKQAQHPPNMLRSSHHKSCTHAPYPPPRPEHCAHPPLTGRHSSESARVSERHHSLTTGQATSSDDARATIASSGSSKVRVETPPKKIQKKMDAVPRSSTFFFEKKLCRRAKSGMRLFSSPSHFSIRRHIRPLPPPAAYYTDNNSNE